MINEVDALLIPVVVSEEALSDDDASDQAQEASEDGSSDGAVSEAVEEDASPDEWDSSYDDDDEVYKLGDFPDRVYDDDDEDNDLEKDFYVRVFDPDQKCDDNGVGLFDCDPDVREYFGSPRSGPVPKQFQSRSLEEGAIYEMQEDCRGGNPSKTDGSPVSCFEDSDTIQANSVRSWAKSPTSTQQRLGFGVSSEPSGFFNRPITIGPFTVAPTRLLKIEEGAPKPHNPLAGLQLQLARRLKMRWYHASGSFMGKRVFRVPTVVVKGERVSVLPGCALQGPDTQVHSVRIQADLKGKALRPAQTLSLVALKEVLGAYWTFATTPY